MVNIRRLELEAAKEILKEVFHARPSDVEDMIQSRLEEKHWNEERWTLKRKVYGRKSSAWVIRWGEASRA
jgi:hypothetical protein